MSISTIALEMNPPWQQTGDSHGLTFLQQWLVSGCSIVWFMLYNFVHRTLLPHCIWHVATGGPAPGATISTRTMMMYTILCISGCLTSGMTIHCCHQWQLRQQSCLFERWPKRWGDSANVEQHWLIPIVVCATVSSPVIELSITNYL